MFVKVSVIITILSMGKTMMRISVTIVGPVSLMSAMSVLMSLMSAMMLHIIVMSVVQCLS